MLSLVPPFKRKNEKKEEAKAWDPKSLIQRRKSNHHRMKANHTFGWGMEMKENVKRRKRKPWKRGLCDRNRGIGNLDSRQAFGRRCCRGGRDAIDRGPAL